VNVQTLATHTDKTERCSGDLQAVRVGTRRWRVNPAGISCRTV
jgi:hypothetical protein